MGFNTAPVFKAVPANKPLKIRYFENGEKDDELSFYMTSEPVVGGSRTLAIMSPPDKPPLMWKSSPKRVQMINLELALKQNKNLVFVNHLPDPVYVEMFGQKMVKIGGDKVIAVPVPDGGRPFAEYEAFKDQKRTEAISFGSFALARRTVTVLAFYPANPKVNGGSKIASFCNTISLPKPIENK